MMAYKSLLLSLALSAIVGYSFTVGLTNPNSLLRKLPDWTFIPIAVSVFVLYLLATWWAFKGFGAHKTAALVSLGLCAFGFGLYFFAFSMEMGKGKAAPGQYDAAFSALDPTERTILTTITQSVGLRLEDAVFTQHWHMAESGPGFRICVQKGRITALNFSGIKIADLAPFSQLTALGDLYLNNCGLSDMSALRSEKLDRLELADNAIADLKTLSGCPNLRWIVLKNNKLHSKEGIELFSKLLSQDLTGNPL